jgi:WD40 repeat protein
MVGEGRWLNMKLMKIIIVMLVLLSGLVGVNAQEVSQNIFDYRYVTPSWSHAGDRLALVFERQVQIRSTSRRDQNIVLDGCDFGPDFWRPVWNPDDRLVAAGCSDATIAIWNADTGEQIALLGPFEDPFGGFAWSPDQRTFHVTGGEMGLPANVWDTQSWTVVDTYNDVAPSGIVFNANSSQAALFIGDFLRIIDPASYSTLFISRDSEYSDGIDNILMLAWSPDGTRIVTGLLDGRIMVRSVPALDVVAVYPISEKLDTQQDHHPLQQVRAVSFSADGQQVLSIAGDGTFQAYDLTTQQVISTRQYPQVSAASFSAYGGQLALLDASLLPIYQEGVASLNQAVPTDLLTLTVPMPTQTTLEQLGAACGLSARSQQAATDLTAFTAQVESLPDTQIPPGCRADLLAVAAALQGE